MFLPMEAYPKAGESVPNYFGNLMETALMFFASGAFWSLTGMTFAALTDSKYMAYASPFVLFYPVSYTHLADRNHCEKIESNTKRCFAAA